MSFAQVSGQLVRTLISSSGKLNVLSNADIQNLHLSDRLLCGRRDGKQATRQSFIGTLSKPQEISNASIQDFTDHSLLITKGLSVDGIHMCGNVFEEKHPKDPQKMPLQKRGIVLCLRRALDTIKIKI
jgi:hypothetical protein